LDRFMGMQGLDFWEIPNEIAIMRIAY